jgi:hypothetical protein
LFERAHHVRVAAVLHALDAELLRGQRCFFGGGTAITLSHGEYRESLDIDLLVSELAGYRAVRERILLQGRVDALARSGVTLEQSRDLRADQYGIRTLLRIGGVDLKFEIVHESRIALQEPSDRDQVCGVSTLTRMDMAATKLLANSDRWADDSVFSRDLIDLAMVDLPSKLRAKALEKAEVAYGDSVRRDLARAIQRLRERTGRLETCMQALSMTLPRAVVWSRIRRWMPKS